MKVFAVTALVMGLLAFVALPMMSGAKTLAQSTTTPSPSISFPPAAMQFEKSFLDYLTTALKQTGSPARINYEGCPLPRLNFDLPVKGASGLDAIHQMIAREPQVTVSQDASGMIRVVIGKPPTEILGTRIEQLSLNKYAQYSPELSLVKLDTANEILAAEKRLDMHFPLETMSIIVSGPIKGAPHLPPTLDNVTLDQALDDVARTFAGFVFYKTCHMANGKEFFETRFQDRRY